MRKIFIIILNLVIYSAFAQNYLGLETQVPTNWSSTNDRLSISSAHYKMGAQSVMWEWEPTDIITISNPSGLANACKEYKGGMILWVYNEDPKNENLRFEFKNGAGQVQYYFNYHIDFTGWRACWIRFDEDMLGIKQDKNLVSMTIKAPNSTSGGKLFFDRMKFPSSRVSDRVTPDAQLDYINPEMNANHWAALWHWHSTYVYDISLPASVSSDEIAAFAEIRKRITDNIDGSAPTTSRISAIRSEYADLFISRAGDQITGAAFVPADEYVSSNGDKRFNELDDLIYDIAKAWYHKQESGFDQMFIDMLDWLYDQGLNVGSGMGANHHYGYEFRGFPKAIWLMQDVLKAAGKFDEAFEMIQYWTGVPEIRQLPVDENFQGIVDAWNTIIPGRLMTVMLREDSPELVRDMQSFVRWNDAMMKPSVGLMGGFKPDGAGFHHGMIYAGYLNGGYGGLSELLCYLGNTLYNFSEESRANFRKALDVHAWYSNQHSMVNSVCGRKPMNQNMGTGAINAFAYLAKATDPIDEDAAGQYLRLTKYKKELYNEFVGLGIAKGAAPTGNKSINYGALNLHRRDNWLVATKGFNTIVTGTEIYTSNNRYGRYQSYGTVQILASGSPVSAEKSGYVLEGWDWNRFPGATTIHLPYDLLNYSKSNINERSANAEFAGSCSLGDNGIFGMILDENNHTNYTDDFVACKSVFAFDNRIICLGSNINNSNSQYNTETTLFQAKLVSTSESIQVNEASVSQFPYTDDIFVNEPITMLDTKGQGYYLPSGHVNIQKTLQESRDNKNKSVNSGNFATAWLNHGTAPVNEEYEYAILVQTNASALSQFKTEMTTENAPYQVIRKDEVAHVLKDRDTKTTGYVLFEANSNISQSHIKATSYPCLVMVKDKDTGGLNLSMADPALNMEVPTSLVSTAVVQERKIQLTLNGSYALANPSGSCRLVSSTNNQTILEFTCIHGLAVEIELIKDDVSASDDLKIEEGNDIVCYPNPVKDMLYFKKNMPIEYIQIFNQLGILKLEIQEPGYTINVTDLQPGLYFVHTDFAGADSKVSMFVKL
ncbi:T9SS type A sorting domain-containing protein [Labilibacter sediminis]|nr:T9SS type A sorting domain-containing protein [Labilibacter sediminis]